MKTDAYPHGMLTVIIRDDAPMIHCGDSPSYRTVRVELTADQIKLIGLKHTHSVAGVDYHEAISQCIID